MAVDGHHGSINLCQQRQLHTGGENDVNIQCGEKIFFISVINQDGEAKSLFLLNFVTVKDSPFLRSREKSFLEVPSL